MPLPATERTIHDGPGPSLPRAILFGGIAAVVGALIWGGITYATNFQIGWMAVGVGFLAGVGVRIGSRDSGAVYGTAGAVLALGGCLLGNMFAMLFIAKHLGLDPGPRALVEMMKITASPMDFLFYAIAAWEGWKFGAGSHE